MSFLISLVFTSEHQSLSLLASGLKTSISTVAIHKRFTEAAVNFLKQIVVKLLKINLAINLDSEILKPFSKILILDSSSWKIPSALAEYFPGFNSRATKAMCKLQLAYDFLAGQIDFFDIQKGTSNDNAYAYTEMNLSLIQPQTLVIADLGYFSTQFFSEIHQRKAFFVSRLKYDANVYCPITKKSIDLLSLIKKTKLDNFEIKVLIKSRKNQYVPCRLIVQRVPEEIAEIRRRKKNKRKNNLKQKTSQMCSWTMMITNLDEKEMPANHIYHFYQIRWQIELIFKQFKSVLKIHKINTANKHRLLCEVYGKMIFAIIISKLHGKLNSEEWANSTKQISFEKFIKQISSQAFLIKQNFNLVTVGSALNLLAKLIQRLKKYCLKSEHRTKPSTLTLLNTSQELNVTFLCPAFVIALS